VAGWAALTVPHGKAEGLSTVHVVGASGRSGQAICRALLERGVPVVPVVRSAARWAATGLPGTPRIADLTGAGLDAALADATRVVSGAHARHIPAILAAAPCVQKSVFLGSTRKFTRWPDAHGNGVLAGEAAFHASGRAGVLLHPTMIYGATGENNVQRLAALLRRLPLVPLPGGGRALVQPIHQSDVTRSILAALDADWSGPESLVIAGPEPLSYADFVRAVAAAAGLRPPRMVPVLPALLRLASPLTLLPGLPRIGADEIRRLLEDKAFDIGPMRTKLGVTPIPLAAGLAATLCPPASPANPTGASPCP
jgi:nucleoside-diphosphate-sugar epimerase